MKEFTAEIINNRKIAEGIHEMVLEMVPAENAETCREARDNEAREEEAREQEARGQEKGAADFRPGQFVGVSLPGFFLRRPISVCDWDGQRLTLVYKEAGRGTEAMSRLTEGERLKVLGPLGNGYRMPDPEEKKQPLLIGGGVGVPPVYCLCRRMAEQGIRPMVILGFRSAGDAFYTERFEALGITPIVTTEDGSLGIRGFVTDAMKGLEYGSVYACGPKPMLRAADEAAPEGIPGQFSFEERMGCGFGACMGCTCRTKTGSKRVCKDGPVLERGEILWQEQ